MTSRIVVCAGLVVAGTAVVTVTAVAEDPGMTRQTAAAKPKSGYAYLERATRQMQDDDFANPGFFFVDAGAELWRRVAGKAGKSCAGCHKAAARSMKGVGARYPAYDQALGKVINLEQRINRCRREQMKADPLPWESDGLLSLTTYVRHQSRGLPVNVSVQGQAAQSLRRGKAFWFRRRGLFDIACSHCHDDSAGRRLRAEIVSQGQTNGFPAYKLKWQKVGSAHRQFRRCNRLARSTPYPFGAQAYVDLELYLAWRGMGLKVETPAVRP